MTELKQKDILTILTLIRANYDGAYPATSKEESKLLINLWYDSLKAYPAEIVLEGTKNAIAHNAYAPRLANIIDEINRLYASSAPSEEELWGQLTAVLGKVYDISRYFRYPQHYNWASGKIKEIYDGLEGDIKLFVVNPSSLVELAEMPPESLAFEKARFFKRMPDLRQKAKYQQQSQDFMNRLASSTPKQISDTTKNNIDKN
jgi:hypothetical protein